MVNTRKSRTSNAPKASANKTTKAKRVLENNFASELMSAKKKAKRTPVEPDTNDKFEKTWLWKIASTLGLTEYYVRVHARVEQWTATKILTQHASKDPPCVQLGC